MISIMFISILLFLMYIPFEGGIGSYDPAKVPNDNQINLASIPIPFLYI